MNELVSSWAPRWRVAAYLGLAAALNYADRVAFSAVMQPLREELALTDVTLGLLSSLFLWSYALGSPFAGILADRWRRGRVVVASLLVWSAVTALTGLASSVWQLATLRILLGFSECLFLPAAFALVADHHGQATRARAMSVLSIGVSTGVVAGGAAAGYLAEHVGWRYGFFVLGGLGILVALVSQFFVTEPVRASEPKSAAPVLVALKFLAGVPTYHVLLAKTMLAGFAVWIFLSWLPLYFRENFGLGLGAAGFAGTFMLQIMATVGIAIGGWMSDLVAKKEPRRRLLTLAVSYSLIAPTLFAFFGQPGFAWAIVIVSGFSLLRGVGDSTEKPSLCEVIPPSFRATAIGLMNALATAAGGVGVFLAGWLKRDVGLNGVFAACALVYFIASVLLVLAYRYWMANDVVRMRQYQAEEAARIGIGETTDSLRADPVLRPRSA